MLTIAIRAIHRVSAFLALMALALVVLTPSTASASVDLSFSNITNNSTETGALYSVTVSGNADDNSIGTNQVLFTFKVSSGATAGQGGQDIDAVYFQDGTLLGIAAPNYKNSGTVAFSDMGVNPQNLPGGSSITPQFVTHDGFSEDANSPSPSNGVNAGESLGVLFNLQNGKTFNDVINALNVGAAGFNADGSDITGVTALRIGIHVQNTGTNNNKSDSFVNAVPEPSTIALALSGFGALGFAGLRHARRKATTA
jgi:hypothetical protein